MLTIEPVIAGYEISLVNDIGEAPAWQVTVPTPAHIKLITDHYFREAHRERSLKACPLCLLEQEKNK